MVGGLEVGQFFLREYSEERSRLAALAQRLIEDPVLVSTICGSPS